MVSHSSPPPLPIVGVYNRQIEFSVATPAPGQPLPPAVGLRGLSEPRRSDSADQERPATRGPPERYGANDIAGALHRAHAGLSVRVRARDGSPSRPARQRRQERVPHGTRNRRDQRIHLARSAAHVRVLADHEGRLASIGGRTPRPSRPAYGDAICPSLAGVPVSGSGSVRRDSSDTAAGSSQTEKRARKGQRAATRDQRPAKVVEFPKGLGSSGWTRTSNPPVNSKRRRAVAGHRNLARVRQ